MNIYRYAHNGRVYTIHVEPDGKGWHAYSPELPGLHAGGCTKEKAHENAEEAAQAYMASIEKHGDPMPVGVGT